MDGILTAQIEETSPDHQHKTQNGFPRSVSSNSEDEKIVINKPKSIANGLHKGPKHYPDYIQINVPVDSRNTFPSEWWKTGIAFVYALFNMILTTVMITVVHERVPPKEVSPPLPDKFFDYVSRVPWAFSVSEISGMILVGLWTIQWLFFRYKSIVSRRFFFILGTLYFYRCITIYVTTLPVPGVHFQCAPKLHGDSQAQLQRILRLLSGGGLSITGSHILCGDFLYSGHTVILTLTYLFIKEYTPRRLWWYHLICWLLSAAGVICILLAHEHYTVDVIIAYYITTRLFWCYHAMANEKCLKISSQTNFLSRTWWFPVFLFFERNVQACIPCSFSWPISWPPGCFKASCKTYSRVQKTGEDVEKAT
ncbi:hypothetical protein GDO86_000592 [Hymenochirus boettgeri]|uniref:Sphingomyelin synthase-like domain-containing protein n=1 Tax=Hymenochirus boettgeri TaxID=247094 RepID=A0A8T2KEK8_9PIPI|nr:hypothetical protein GDO86_000592 [Hymenochirus boettgeri]